jgi:crotonobetainyl-CoA:carnitine CoA-transferase CaiB-like acyl-CoA transferase
LRADVSIQESELTLNRTRLNRYLNEGVCVGREGRRYGITGMLECRDGWIQLVGMREEHWDRLVGSADGAVFRAAGMDSAAARAERNDELGGLLAGWCAERAKDEAASLLAAVGAPVGTFAEPADCVSSQQLLHRGFFRAADDGAGATVTIPGPPYRFSALPPAAGSPPTPAGRAGRRLLEGIKVLDFTWAAAGPYATLLLAFLGADVVKVESSRRLDPARRGFVSHHEGFDRSPIFNELNLNKRSLRIDLTQPESRPIIEELLPECDIVVDNFRPGVMDRLGLGAQTLLTAHPHLIVASSSANGSTGPDAMAAGLASIFAASGGLSAQTGYPDGPPTEIADPMDYRSGTALAVAIVAGLLGRARTGAGRSIDLSSREVVLAGSPDALLAFSLGVDWSPRVGNGHRTMAPHGVYRCAGDGWVAIAVGDPGEWAGLCRALEREEWIERFPRPDDRRRADGRLSDEITRWTQARSASQAADTLQAHGVPSERVMTFAALAADEHLAGRAVFADVQHPLLGAQRVLKAPWRFLGREDGAPRPGPLLGADNDRVLSGSGRAAELPVDRRATVFN